MIHATPELVSMWTHTGALREDGPRLVTVAKGTIIVAGSGYPGTGPLGHANAAATADTCWAFASGLVHLRYSEIVVTPDNMREALNRANNTVTYGASRYAAASFDPHIGPYAVRVNLAA